MSLMTIAAVMAIALVITVMLGLRQCSRTPVMHWRRCGRRPATARAMPKPLRHRH